MFRDYLPGIGTTSARSRWRELREEALALDVVAALAWTKWIEQNIRLLSNTATVRTWAVWLAVALFVTSWYVHSSRIKEAAEAATDAVEDAVEGADA